MAGDAAAAGPTLRVRSVTWRSPVAFALLVGLGGLLIAGAVGGLVGVVAGFAAARRPQAVLISAAVALCAAALLTVVEEPLTTAGVPFFPGNHPLAELAGKLAAVLLLAGLAGTFMRGERSLTAQSLPTEQKDLRPKGLSGSAYRARRSQRPWPQPWSAPCRCCGLVISSGAREHSCWSQWCSF